MIARELIESFQADVKVTEDTLVKVAKLVTEFFKISHNVVLIICLG